MRVLLRGQGAEGVRRDADWDGALRKREVSVRLVLINGSLCTGPKQGKRGREREREEEGWKGMEERDRKNEGEGYGKGWERESENERERDEG